MKKEWTIVQDTREKKPLRFPANLRVLDDHTAPHRVRMVTVRLHTVKEKLDTGDYLLRGFESTTIIERKGSLREVANNCLSRADRPRFVECLTRLRDSCKHPVIMLEGTPLSMARVQRGVQEPDAAVDALLRLVREYRIELLLLPGSTHSHRRACANWVARALIAGALNDA